MKFIGDMSPASEPADLESVPPELRDRAFQVRPVWQRFLVVLAGPAANFLLAIVIFTAFFSLVGAPRTNIVGDVLPDTACCSCGNQAGDRILSVADRTRRRSKTSRAWSSSVPTKPSLSRSIARRHQAVQVKLASSTIPDRDRPEVQAPGCSASIPTTEVTQPVPLFQAVPMACEQTADDDPRQSSTASARSSAGRVSPKQLGGPITIAQVAGQGAELGFLPFIELLALLSINLGFINLLPVPMLDGGHLFFYAVEAVRRRPLSAQALEWAFRGGLALILALVVFTDHQ